MPWVIEGAAVAVSIVCFATDDDASAATSTLDGRPVRAIRSDLRDADLPFDLRNLRFLAENRGVAFQGVKVAGRRADDDDEQDEEEKGFVVEHATAELLLNAGGNPNGRPNTDVVRRYWSGDEALAADAGAGDEDIAISVGVGGSTVPSTQPSCMIPDFDGAFLSQESKDALWHKFFTAAPQRQRRSVEQYKIVKRA